jgi:SAM dependent carboxyl methyltransferase
MTQPTQGMKRGGYYDAHSEYQQRVAASGTTLLAPLLESLVVGHDGPLTVVDYGCASGATSIAVIADSVRILRRSDPERLVVTVHNDLPTSDFNALVANLEHRDDSYLRLRGAPVLPMVSPTSFYGPVVPPASAHLGLSFSAAHWLRKEPVVPVSGSFLIADATGDDRAALARQADGDWTAFLERRAAELAPGALLFVQMIGTETRGGGDHVTAARLLHAMRDVAEAMVDTTQLDIGAFHGFVFPTYMRTIDEAVAPLERADSPVRDAFHVELARVDPVPNPYFEAYRASGDAAAYAEQYVSFVRAFSESSLRDGLFAPGSRDRPPDEALDEFYDELRRRTALDPEWSMFEDWTLTVALTRTT